MLRDGKNYRVGLLDSGAGGLTVLAEIIRKVPGASYHYLCDNLYYPYGELESSFLLTRVLKLCLEFTKQQSLDLLVIPCNTASSVVLDSLREHLCIPVVGVVPAVKVAAEFSRTKHFAVLATKGTIEGAYLSRLIHDFAQQHQVLTKASAKLVDLSEQKLRGRAISQKILAIELEDIFADERIDSVVLGCTHYSHLIHDLKELEPRPIEWIDSRKAVANRVAHLLGCSGVSKTQLQNLTIFYTDQNLFSEEQKKYWGKYYSTKDFRLFEC